MIVQNANNLGKLLNVCQPMLICGYLMMPYRVVRLVCLAESCRNTVDLFNHVGQILVKIIQTIRELLRKLVSIDRSAKLFDTK